VQKRLISGKGPHRVHAVVTGDGTCSLDAAPQISSHPREGETTSPMPFFDWHRSVNAFPAKRRWGDYPFEFDPCMDQILRESESHLAEDGSAALVLFPKESSKRST